MTASRSEQLMPHPYTVLFVGGFAAFRFFRWYFSDQHRNHRALAGLSTRRIQDVKAGEVVRIEGRVRALSEVLAAPLTGRTCVHFDLRVEKRTRKGRATELVRDVRSVAFDVNDETGTARIEVRSFFATVDLDEETRSDDELTTPEAQILAAHGGHERNLLGLRVDELSEPRLSEALRAE